MESLALEKRGLVLICGVTSSGKSTTLASMVDFRNSMIGGHIITIEDPIEFYHEHKKAIITQREIDIDTVSHHVALKNALRQKPDVIMVGEVRDAGVMELTIAAAETGHLCYATLHASNAGQAIERIISLFRESRQQQCRVALAMNLRAIVVQRLVPTIKGGMTLVAEVMLNEALVREHIMSGDTDKIREVMAKNNTSGMITFDQSLFESYKNNLISEETAIAEADLPTNMKINIRQYLLSGKGTGAIPDIDTSKLSL
jgi:twitching motility protein PilU